ncbi:hypothetical protein [Acaryochloris sp. IP29b_bin.148]|uniref:hypothetical protein n=1 Tax=Acaryochloris sp. IP29b_bin.148 TaxID=2969218 RepID=UPI002616487C|nr:hypothetical protein [Acaryochloris sp. IP29b_bin.148]
MKKRVFISIFLRTTVFIISILFFATVAIPNAEAARLTVDGWKVEYWRNHPIGTPSDNYNQAVIVIHGNSRNADDYYDYVMQAAETQSQLNTTLIVSPKFKVLSDSPADDELYWSSSGWKKGFKSKNGSFTPSFRVVDHILGKINNNFPNISFVTIVGHSAGGQFVQRYAALNQKQQALRSDLSVRYVVANPGSYMYLDSTRSENISGCTDYDNYKYGMANLPGVLSYTKLSKTQIRNQITSRSIYLLLGTQDNDPNSNSLDTSCKANAQGFNRYARGLLYYQHVKCLNSSANHIKVEVNGVGHSGKKMFNATEGRKVIFDDN